MELALERVPFLGGSVVYVLRAVEAGSYPQRP
jgi:hypothetical protein